MGLFTGMSVLSIFEILFWIVRIVLRIPAKAKKQHGTIIKSSTTLEKKAWLVRFWEENRSRGTKSTQIVCLESA